MSNAKYEVISQTVEILLSPGSIQFEVPAFQRRYAWGAEEITQLVDDIYGDSDPELPYFLGSIVVATQEAKEGIEPLLVLDGQQRLTTLSLIIAVLVYKLKIAGYERADFNLSYLISKRLRGKESPKIMHQVEDSNIYRPIIESPDVCIEQSYKHTKIGQATQKIMSLIEEYCPASESLIEAYTEMLEKILYGVEIVRIKAPSEKDAFRLFETLNDRGLALSAADLIKNKLFSHCGVEIEDAIDAWTSMIGCVQDDDIVNFLRYYWIANHGFSRKRELYDKYKSYINKLDSTKATLFAIELEEYAKSYAEIINTNKKSCPWGDDVAEVLERINAYRAKSCRSTILACSKKHSSSMKKIVDMCESISVRYSIVGEKNPNQLEKIYSEIAQILRESNAPFVDIHELESLKEVPNDNDFKNKLENMEITSITPAWREFLTQLNKPYSTGETKIESPSKVHVEHILPQKPRATVLKESGLTQEEAEDLMNRIGNLTLLSGKKNRELSNKPFSDKKDIYNKSEIMMTRMVAENEKWGQKEIEARSKKFSEDVIKIFPHPKDIL